MAIRNGGIIAWVFLFLSGCALPAKINFWPFADGKPQDCVVVLHGLARSSKTIESMATVLRDHQYRVVNPDYPSTDYTIEVLSASVIPPALQFCRQQQAKRIHFVTHSMGGILVRYYLQNHEIPEFGRFVMLAPPNQGSKLIDVYRDSPGFNAVVGPAGAQLGTDDQSIPRQLNPLKVETGIISGTTTANPWTSLSLPNPDDGKVSVSSTYAEGMCVHVQLPVSHRFISKKPQVQKDVLTYLSKGEFSSPETIYYPCHAAQAGN